MVGNDHDVFVLVKDYEWGCLCGLFLNMGCVVLVILCSLRDMGKEGREVRDEVSLQRSINVRGIMQEVFVGEG